MVIAISLEFKFFTFIIQGLLFFSFLGNLTVDRGNHQLLLVVVP